jgi:putative transposase
MPRKPRFYLPGIAVHIVQRGNARQAVFFDDSNYRAYLNWLFEGASKHGCSVHAYVLMTNHVHLLATPDSKDSISRMIQFVGRNYVTYINNQFGRSGTLWEGRHKGSLINSSEYALACYRYIEMNPVRAGMVDTPGEYPWSSYQANAYGVNSRLSPLQEYKDLARTDEERQYAYRELFRSNLGPDKIHSIQSSVQTGTPLGNDIFKGQIEVMLGRRVGYARRGRPSKDLA